VAAISGKGEYKLNDLSSFFIRFFYAFEEAQEI